MGTENSRPYSIKTASVAQIRNRGCFLLYDFEITQDLFAYIKFNVNFFIDTSFPSLYTFTAILYHHLTNKYLYHQASYNFYDYTNL